MTTHLLWLRNDLRINDNSALAAACHDKKADVMALFIATPKQWRQHSMSAKQATFIHQNLCELQQALAEHQYHRHDRAGLDDDVEEVRTGTQPVLGDEQVAGAGDRQELGQAFEDAQQQGGEQVGHGRCGHARQEGRRSRG